MKTGRKLNRRETGVRKPEVDTDPDPNDDFSQEAAENRKPRGAFGLSEPAKETQAKTRKSGGVEPPKTPEQIRKRDVTRSAGKGNP